jgi:hypothetical protein
MLFKSMQLSLFLLRVHLRRFRCIRLLNHGGRILCPYLWTTRLGLGGASSLVSWASVGEDWVAGRGVVVGCVLVNWRHYWVQAGLGVPPQPSFLKLLIGPRKKTFVGSVFAGPGHVWYRWKGRAQARKTVQPHLAPPMQKNFLPFLLQGPGPKNATFVPKPTTK